MKHAIKYQMVVPLGAGRLRLERDNQRRLRETKALAVEVIYTTDHGTQCALEKAWALANDLGARVRIIYIYAVPYALPLEKPAVPLPFLQNKLVKLAGDFPGEVSVQIFLCREVFRALKDALPQSSLVVLGGTRRWWLPTKEQQLERRLKKLGHQVIFAKAG
jgi:hypothetical protein